LFSIIKKYNKYWPEFVTSAKVKRDVKTSLACTREPLFSIMLAYTSTTEVKLNTSKKSVL
jgi:hypothetical protein